MLRRRLQPSHGTWQRSLAAAARVAAPRGRWGCSRFCAGAASGRLLAVRSHHPRELARLRNHALLEVTDSRAARRRRPELTFFW